MGDFFVGMINALIEALGRVLGSILIILPDSPFESISSVQLENKLLAGLMWIVPAGEIVAVLEAWVGAIALYYVVMIALRWVKAIE